VHESLVEALAGIVDPELAQQRRLGLGIAERPLERRAPVISSALPSTTDSLRSYWPSSHTSSSVTHWPALLQRMTAPWNSRARVWSGSTTKSTAVPRTPMVPVGVAMR